MKSWKNLLAEVNERVVKGKHKVIVGLGETGYSVAKHLLLTGVPFEVLDSNPAPARFDDLQRLVPGIELHGIHAGLLLGADEIIVSPGVPLSLPELQLAVKENIKVSGDVAMFGELARAPVIAITGSNGKSTVTSMVGALARAQMAGVEVAGNIGTPCLDVLGHSVNLYVLEVSSYQLELATDLPLKVAALLNLSPDHMDRYPDVEHYYNTKGNIYNNCEIAVINRQVKRLFETKAETVISFGTDKPINELQFGVIENAGELILMQGDEQLLKAGELFVRGKHNVQNVLAALAIGHAASLTMEGMVDEIKRYKGLAHRCEWLGEFGGVGYVNDSKATNIGASISAVEGFGSSGNILLILGGQGKGADFSLLAPSLEKYVKKVLVFGRDQECIQTALQQTVAVESCSSFEEVIDTAVREANPGDTVLFSPACASFDMFENYENRGFEFKRILMEKVQ
jgi:UDP-N-acetylmuramoylalanine--D-glutamate ligase